MTKLPKPKVIQPTAKNIAAHFQSPLNKGQKNQKIGLSKKTYRSKFKLLGLFVFKCYYCKCHKILLLLFDMINFAINKAFNKYFDFGGRSNRSEFWYFFLFIFIGSSIFHLIDTYIIGYHEEEMGIVSGIFG